MIKPPVIAGLAGWWPFDEGAGSVARDVSGFGNHGTLVGPPTWVNGKTKGKSLSFNGSSYVTLPFGSNFTPTAMTIAVWLNVTNFSSNPRLIANSHTDSDSKGFQLMINNGGASGFFDVAAAGGHASASWTSTISTGQWYHYAGVYTGSLVLAYINGVQVATASTSGAIIAGSNNFSIGYNATTNGDFLTGLIDDVRLYKRALSASEIKILANFY